MRILSPEIGHWKYSFSVNYVSTTVKSKRPLPPDYNDRFEIYDKNVYWIEYNLDLQYLIDLDDKIMIYPYLGGNISKIKSNEQCTKLLNPDNLSFGLITGKKTGKTV